MGALESLISVGLIACFEKFGSLKIEWPGKDDRHNRHPPKGNFQKTCNFFMNNNYLSLYFNSSRFPLSTVQLWLAVGAKKVGGLSYLAVLFFTNLLHPK